VLSAGLEVEVEVPPLIVEELLPVVEGLLVGVLITLPADTTTIVTGMHGFIGSKAKRKIDLVT
jgi:hypothetical protein